MVRLISRNQTLLIAAHYPSQMIVRYAWRILIGQLLWGALAFRHGAGIGWIQGKWEGLRLFGAMRKTRPPVPAQPLDCILSESEQEIHELQQRTGFDWFWRAYFALT